MPSREECLDNLNSLYRNLKVEVINSWLSFSIFYISLFKYTVENFAESIKTSIFKYHYLIFILNHSQINIKWNNCLFSKFWQYLRWNCFLFRFLEEFKTPKRHFSKLPDLYLVKSKYLLTIAIFSNKLYEKTTKLKAKSNLEMQQLYLEEVFKYPFQLCYIVWSLKSFELTVVCNVLALINRRHFLIEN